MSESFASGPREARRGAIDAEAQHRAAELVQKAMYFYWHGGDPQHFERELFRGITLKGRFDLVEQCFREAIQLVPDRLDLRFSLASTLVVQDRVADAQRVYAEIAAMDPRGFDAPLMHAAYCRAVGKFDEADSALAALAGRHRERTERYRARFDRLEAIIREPLRTKATRSKTGAGHAIVVLGYALARDGSLQPTKLRRLQKALELAALCDSPIVLTGGVQQSGVTEAFIMSRWLQEHGVVGHRLRLEDQAEDTVGNAIFSAPILRELGATRVTVISSGSHLRRSLVVFDEAVNGKGGASVEFDHLAEMDFAASEEADLVGVKERVFIYRDLLRASGLWAYPGIQR